MFRLPAITFCLCLTALLCGCDNNPHPAPLHATRPDGSPWVVRYQSLRGDPRSFDPQFTYDQISRKVVEGLYDTLLEYHPMKTAPYEVRPCLLAELPQSEEGGMSYLCRLKPDLHYHDDPCFPGGKGREIVAEDVQYIFQRISDPKLESPFESTFEEYLIGIAETYAAAKQAGRLDYDTMRVAGIEVLDRYRFRVRMKKKYPQILYWFAFYCTAPVAREAVEFYDGKIHDGNRREDFRKFKAVGTGPYRVTSYTPRSRVVLERAPGYKTTVFPSDGFPPEKAEWLSTLAGKSVPFIDEVQFVIQSENIPRFVMLRQGYLDGMAVDRDSFNSMVSPVRAVSTEFASRGVTLEKDFEICTFWTCFNMDDPLVGKNVKLRKALAHAFDGARYSEIFYSGVPPVPTQLVPQGIFGFDPKRPAPFPYDLEKAKKLLAEAGYPDGRDASGKQLELTLTDNVESSEYRQRAEFHQRGIEKLGIRVKVNGVTFAKLQDIEDKGDFQIVGGTGWGADYPDPENFFMLFYSKNIPPAGKDYARYRNPEYDRVFEQMAVMPNGPERAALVRQLQKFLDDDCPMFPGFTKAFYTAVQPWARRTHDNLMYEVEGGIKYLTTDVAMRERLRREWNRPLRWPAYALGALGLAALLGFIRTVRRSKNQTA